MESMPAADISRITLLWIGRLGDIIVTTPFFRALRARFPKARIRLVTAEAGAEGARLAGLDEVFVLRRFYRPLENLRIVKALKSQTDLLVDCNASYSRASRLLGNICKSPRRLGFAKDGDRHFNMRVDGPDLNEHMLSRYARLAKALGAPYDASPKLELPQSAHEVGEAIWQEHAPSGPRILIHPGNFKKTGNRWPEDKFVSLIGRMLDAKQGAYGLLAGPGEEAPVGAMARALKGRVPVLGPAPSEITSGIIGASHLLVGNGTGTTHLATALKTSTVSFVNGYAGKIWMPAGFAGANPQSKSLDSGRKLVTCRLGNTPHTSLVSNSWEQASPITIDEA